MTFRSMTTPLGLAALAASAPDAALAQLAAPAIDAGDIGSIVTRRMGPQAGAWVVPETADLGTGFAKMAVTKDSRRYGLVDSSKVTATTLDLAAVIAPNFRPPHSIIRLSVKL
jgi:hypothetical protein